MGHPSFSEVEVLELCNHAGVVDSYVFGEKSFRSTNKIRDLYEGCSRDLSRFIQELIIKSDLNLPTSGTVYDLVLEGLCTPFPDIPLKLNSSNSLVKDLYLCRLRLGK